MFLGLKGPQITQIAADYKTYEGRIELIPEKDITDLRGFLKGNTEVRREADRV